MMERHSDQCLEFFGNMRKEPADIRRRTDVVPTSMRRNDVASTSVRQHVPAVILRLSSLIARKVNKL